MGAPVSFAAIFGVIGMPLFCVLAVIGLAGFHHGGTPLAGAMDDVYRLAHAEAITFSTIPLFTFAGYLMAHSRSAQRLVKLADLLVGWIPGGLAVMTVGTCAFFTVFTGASGVTIVALGGLLYPELEKTGYGRRNSLGVVTGSGAIGLLFPPALPLVVYAIVFSLTAGHAGDPDAPLKFSIDAFFTAGILPGIVLVLILSIYCVIHGAVSKLPRKKLERWHVGMAAGFVAGCVVGFGIAFVVSRVFSHGKVNLAIAGGVGLFASVVTACVMKREFASALWDIKWELPIPVLILLALFLGWANLFEIAVFTAVYVFVIEVFVYKDIDVKRDLFGVTRESMTLVGAIFMKILGATILKAYLVQEGVPERLYEWLSQYVHSQWAFLLVLNVLLLLVGCMMDIFSAIIVVVPLIVPAAAQFGVDPYHLGVIFLLNLEIGYLLPPAGLNLFIAAFRFNRPITELYRAVVPFILLMILALAIVTRVPWLSTALPHFAEKHLKAAAAEVAPVP